MIERQEDRVVRTGTTVAVKIDGSIESFLIGDEMNGKPSESIISSRSPIARALIGRRPGETVEVAAPRGHRYSVKILSLLR